MTTYSDINHDTLNDTVVMVPSAADLPTTALRLLVLASREDTNRTAANGFDWMAPADGSAPIPALFYVEPHFYDARTIMYDVTFDDKHTFGDSLPDPVEFPPGLKTLPPAELQFVLDYLSGDNRSLLEARNGGPENCARIMQSLDALDPPITLLPAKKVAFLIQRARADQVVAVQKITESRPLVAANAAPVIHQMVVETEEDSFSPTPAVPLTADSPIGPITRIPDHVFNKLVARQQAVALGAPRVSWPFKNLQVGDQVNIAPELAKRGQIAAYMFGRRTKRAFSVQRLKTTGELIVRRLPDPKGR